MRFWKQSMAVGFINRSLAKKVLLIEGLEESFLAGPMHEVEILVSDKIIPQEHFNFLILKDLST